MRISELRSGVYALTISPDSSSLDSLTRLQKKHPQASPLNESLPYPTQFTPLSVTKSDVQEAVLSFSAGSSDGPDGCHPSRT